MANQKRNTAYKVWISNLLNSEYTEGKGEWESNYFKLNGHNVSRVNLIGSVVFVFKAEDNGYRSLSLDDGSGVIRLKAWRDDVKLLEEVNVGDNILVVGRARKYENEAYVTPEVVKKISDPNWEIVRKLELLKELGKFNEVEANGVEIKEEETPKENVDGSRQNVLSVIEKSDGVNVDELKEKSGLGEEEIEKILNDLLKEGEIYESRAGVYMVI
jgi:RPA family protein